MKLKVPDTTTIAFNWIPADLLAREEVWGADLFCGPAAQVLLGQGEKFTLKELGGKCFEGWRVSTNPDASDYDPRIETSPIYRQSNLSAMRFQLDLEHWQKPQIEAQWCVQPGDIVLNKLIPIRAALVTKRTRRHPVDANCLLIRGLEPTTSAWVAFCLNQEFYEAYLTQHQGLAVLPRASLRELRQLRIPPAPDLMMRLGREFWSLNDELLNNEEVFVRCMREVETEVQQKLETIQPNGKDLRSSSDFDRGRFLPTQSIEDSLLPTQVENAYFRYQLQHDLGWIPITKVSIRSEDNRERLSQVDKELPYLQLKDVDQDLMVGEIPAIPVTQATRIFKQPLQEGEVLLSTFAGNPRVAYVDQRPETKVFVTDHWERLRFLETPAAWALVLNSSSLQEQLSGLATGAVQQFIYGDRIEKLLLPDVPLELRQEWEKCVKEHHKRKRKLNQQWQVLWEETQALFQETHPSLGLGKINELVD